VQKLLLEDSDQLLPLLLGDKGSFFVCGSTRMAKDVNTALIQILTGSGGACKPSSSTTGKSLDRSCLLSVAEAEILLSDLKECGRYVQEFW
jgi:sulfite reductase alpha subunit-like flavoprotein